MTTISNIRIRNYRSIQDISIDSTNLTVLIGPNSCGKSNFINALRLALGSDTPDKAYIQKNLPRSLCGPGAPLASIWVDVEFQDISSNLAKIAKQKKGDSAVFEFRATKGGKVKRTINKIPISDDTLREWNNYIELIYVPAIRDLKNGGMEPFHEALQKTLYKSRGDASIRSIEQNLRNSIATLGSKVLDKQKSLLNSILGVNSITPQCNELELEQLIRNVTLSLALKENEIDINEIGTGHQSLLILSLFENIEPTQGASRFFIFEEPDNHLHPIAIRDLAYRTKKLSETSQIFLTTHSSTFSECLGLNSIHRLFQDSSHTTKEAKADLGDFSTVELNSTVSKFSTGVFESLFCERVILVEGPSDKTAIETIFDIRNPGTVEENGIHVLNCNGLSGMTSLAKLLKSLNINFFCIMDWDSVVQGKQPQYISDGEDELVLDAIRLIRKKIPSNRATTGKGGILSALSGIESEISNPKSTLGTIFTGSTCESIVTIIDQLNLSEKSHLKSKLKRTHVRSYRELLKKSNIWVHTKDLESTIIPNQKAADKAYDTIKRLGITPSPGLSQMRGFLHNSANQPEYISESIKSIENSGLYKRTELNIMYNTIFG